MPGEILIINPRGGKPRKVQIMAASKSTKKRKLYGAAAAAHARKASRKPSGGATKRRKARKATSIGSLRGLFNRNPIPRPRALVANVTGMAMAGGLGALGGAAVDLALRPLPVKMKVGPMGILTRAGIAIGAGLLGGRIKPVQAMAQGALTITLYNALRQYVTVPMNLGEISDGDMNELSALVDRQGVQLLEGYETDDLDGYEAGDLDGYETGNTDVEQYEMG